MCSLFTEWPSALGGYGVLETTLNLVLHNLVSILSFILVTLVDLDEPGSA